MPRNAPQNVAGLAPQKRTRNGWETIGPDQMTGKRMILFADGKVCTGGYDASWSGQTWVYDQRKIPAGTVPTYFKPMPEGPDAVLDDADEDATDAEYEAIEKAASRAQAEGGWKHFSRHLVDAAKRHFKAGNS